MIIPAAVGVSLFRNRKGAARKRFKRRSKRRDQRAQRQRQRQSVRKARIKAKGESGYWSPEAVASRSSVVGQLGSAAIDQAGGLLGGLDIFGGDDSGSGGSGNRAADSGQEEYPADEESIDPMLLIGGAAAAGLVIYLATRGKR